MFAAPKGVHVPPGSAASKQARKQAPKPAGSQPASRAAAGSSSGPGAAGSFCVGVGMFKGLLESGCVLSDSQDRSVSSSKVLWWATECLAALSGWGGGCPEACMRVDVLCQS